MIDEQTDKGVKALVVMIILIAALVVGLRPIIWWWGHDTFTTMQVFKEWWGSYLGSMFLIFSGRALTEIWLKEN